MNQHQQPETQEAFAPIVPFITGVAFSKWIRPKVYPIYPIYPTTPVVPVVPVYPPPPPPPYPGYYYY